MNRLQFRRLARKFIANEANLQEKKDLHQQYDLNVVSGNDVANVYNEESAKDLKDKIYKKIELQLNNQTDYPIPAKKIVEKKLNRWIKLSAAALILITVGLSIYVVKESKNQTRFAKSEIKILPGTDKATLTLSNGTKIFLDESAKGELVKQNGITITKTADGELIYSVIDDKTTQSNINGEHGYNTVSTPRGGKYQVNLPDGTKVWLNAATSVRFPVSFKGSAVRNIILNGEAYFEVMPNKNQPFIVTTAKQMIKVLGTHFNVSSYEDENTTKTTLIEGSVRVSRNGGSEFSVLKPGQESSLSGNKFNVYEVDTEDAIAWRNGYFVFENDNLDGILKKLSRWYDVEIDYDGHLNHVRITGSIARESTLQDVLKTLEKTEKFKFNLKERRIIVM